MNKAKQDVLSATMKEAMVQNAFVENKMKATLDAMSNDNKKTLQSLDYYKHKYEKRQRELQNEKHRVLVMRSQLADKTVARKLSAPTLMVNYKAQCKEGIITDSSELQTNEARVQLPGSSNSRQRSVSDVVLPRIYVTESGGGSNSSERSPVRPATEFMMQPLPAIGSNDYWSANCSNQIKASSLFYRPRSSSFTDSKPVNIKPVKSAPSSPAMSRKEFRSMHSARCKSPVGDLEDICAFLNKVQDKRVSDLEEAISNIKDGDRPQEEDKLQQATEDTKPRISPKNGSHELRTRKISSPGAIIHSPLIDDSQDSGNNRSLEESIQKIRYCTYLRRTSHGADHEGGVPRELIPSAIIGGHTKWMPTD